MSEMNLIIVIILFFLFLLINFFLCHLRTASRILQVINVDVDVFVRFILIEYVCSLAKCSVGVRLLIINYKF